MSLTQVTHSTADNKVSAWPETTTPTNTTSVKLTALVERLMPQYKMTATAPANHM